MTILKKIASLLLSLAIVITVLPTAALASALDFGSEVSPIDMVDFDTIGWTNEDMVYVPPEDELEAPIEALSIDILEANDNLYRVREEEEDVYTVVYRNSDTNLSTAYIFDYPVKYTDENGTIRDIDTDITPYLGRNNEIGYSSENNSIKVFYPTSFAFGTGLIATYNDYCVSIGIPQINPENGIAATAEVGVEETETDFDKNYIEYGGAFGPETTLRYYTTYSGYKEQIVLEAVFTRG